MATTSLLERKAQFREIQSLGKTIGILEEKEDFSGSMRELISNGYRAMTKQEVLIHLSQDPELRKILKGKWFWIEGEGLEQTKSFRIDEKGELAKIESIWSLEWYQSVSTRKGNGHLYFSFSGFDYGNDRFCLGANLNPEDVASLVVGIKVDTNTDSSTLQQTESTLRKEA
ncbi:MAG: hypothetical protein ABR981_01360 [Candidatus Micrarchaeaceae archaeon]|jgi:hypothetical protein